jgi:hypothetical protein
MSICQRGTSENPHINKAKNAANSSDWRSQSQASALHHYDCSAKILTRVDMGRKPLRLAYELSVDAHLYSYTAVTKSAPAAPPATGALIYPFAGQVAYRLANLVVAGVTAVD